MNGPEAIGEVTRPGGGERVADRARAVVRGVLEAGVAAAVEVGQPGDRVAGGDDEPDGGRRAGRRLGGAAGVRADAVARRAREALAQRGELALRSARSSPALAARPASRRCCSCSSADSIACARVAARLERLGDAQPAGLHRRERVGLLGDRDARRARAVHDPRLLLADALEEVGLLEQVGEALGLDDDRDEVGLRVAVGGERGSRAARRSPGAGGDEARQAVARLARARPRCGRAWPAARRRRPGSRAGGAAPSRGPPTTRGSSPTRRRRPRAAPRRGSAWRWILLERSASAEIVTAAAAQSASAQMRRSRRRGTVVIGDRGRRSGQHAATPAPTASRRRYQRSSKSADERLHLQGICACG